MNIGGIGIVFTRGRGVDCLADALEQGWRKPAEINTPFPDKPKCLGYLVDSDTIKDKSLLKKIRRSDKFSKMAVLAAADALDNSGVKNPDKKRLGIIVATAFGPHVTTFDYLDGLLDYGDANVSPTTFSNSVHNAAASYIAQVLEIHGPSLTITQFYFSFQHALLMAKVWIDEGRCDYCLVGAVDQYGDAMGYIQNHKLTMADDGKITPFSFKPTKQVPGEGAVFFLVSKNRSQNVFCDIESICFADKTGYNKPVDLNIIDANGTLADESAYISSISPNVPTAAYAPLFGSMLIGSAFNCAVGALMLKTQTYYLNPVTINPHHINLLQDKEASKIKLISCVRYNCDGDSSIIYLKRA